MAGVATRRAAAPEPELINFLDLGFYVAGGGIPDGDYCLFFEAMMYQAKKADGSPAGPSRLGIMVSAWNLNDPTMTEPLTQFYSLGSKAHESFAPNAATGKSLVAIPGGKGANNAFNSTNWAIFLKSLYDCDPALAGLPHNDLTVLDGVWVHTTQIDEPESRKGFKNAMTGEAAMFAQDQNAGPRKIAVVTEIKEDGKPWEGNGGWPPPAAVATNGAGKKPPVVAAKAPPARAAAGPKAPPARAAAPAPPAESNGAGTEEAVLEAAQNGVTEVMAKAPNGTSRLMLKMGVFKHVKETLGDDMVQAVGDAFFSDDDALGQLVGILGYSLDAKTGKISPAA